MSQVVWRKTFISLIALLIFLPFSVFAHPSIIKHPINFSSYKGKWVVLSYWATWCSICMDEIPGLNAFYRAHKDNVVMLGVNYEDGDLSDLPRRIREAGVMFPTLAYDPRGHFGVGRIRGLPTTLLIGPDGRLKRVLTGEQSKSDLERAMNL